MSAPPPPPPPPPPPAPPRQISPQPGGAKHLLTRDGSFSGGSAPENLERASSSDPAIAKLQEELSGLKEELKALEKSPTSKQACEAMIKFMQNEADQNREPLTRPLDATSPWNSAPSSCCTVS